MVKINTREIDSFLETTLETASLTTLEERISNQEIFCLYQPLNITSAIHNENQSLYFEINSERELET